jgi:hypothetical protein
MAKRRHKEPELLPPELLIDCPRCAGKAGERCKAYKGGNKVTCKQRKIAAGVLLPTPEPLKQAELFAPLTETGQGL